MYYTIKCVPILFFFTEEYKRYACNVISEYIPIDIQKSLLKHLGLPEKVECNKRKADENGAVVNQNAKRRNIEYDDVMKNKVEKVIYLTMYYFLN